MPKLTEAERWILANQYRILKFVDPENAEGYEQSITILENGYEDHYERAADGYWERPPLDPEVAQEVRDILQMFREMQWAKEKITDPEILESPLFEFWGFDGNNSWDHHSYAEFLYQIGEYKELDDLLLEDSHSNNIETYRVMVAAWKQLPDGHRGIRMKREDVQAILDAPALAGMPMPDNVVKFPQA